MKAFIIVSVLGLTGAAASLAQTNATTSMNKFSRADSWEAYGVFQSMAVLNVVESNAGIVGGGIGVGYNFSDHFTLNGELSLSSAEFDSGIFGSATEDTTLFMTHVYADFNVLKSPVTPVLSGGFGVGAFSNGTGTALDQTLGLGMRWDANRHLVFKAMIRVGVLETTSSHINDSAEGWALVGFSVGVGYRF